jgi:hypothetical protein
MKKKQPKVIPTIVTADKLARVIGGVRGFSVEITLGNSADKAES